MRVNPKKMRSELIPKKRQGLERMFRTVVTKENKRKVEIRYDQGLDSIFLTFSLIAAASFNTQALPK